MRRRKAFFLFLLLFAGLGCALPALLRSQTPVRPHDLPQVQSTGNNYFRMSTAERVKGAAWWPTKATAKREEFVGPQACVECHRERTASQVHTPMGQASMAAKDSEILKKNPELNFHSGEYAFEISGGKGGIQYKVVDGKSSVTQELQWAFGLGEIGQTYVYERAGSYYESRLSYFPNLKALDLTLGHNAPPPNDLEAALGRKMQIGEVKQCFGCHTTAAVSAEKLEPEHFIPGVTCEACHGPGLRHVLAMREGQQEFAGQTIFNPATLAPPDYVDFCGACHRTAADVALADLKGRVTVRFQPDRLTLSKCWGEGDARLTCRACHDPHEPLLRTASAYDAKCLACHQVAGETKSARVDSGLAGKACPVSRQNCTNCHMPKVDLPGAHAQFTDHKIRIVKNEPSSSTSSAPAKTESPVTQ